VRYLREMIVCFTYAYNAAFHKDSVIAGKKVAWRGRARSWAQGGVSGRGGHTCHVGFSSITTCWILPSWTPFLSTANSENQFVDKFLSEEALICNTFSVITIRLTDYILTLYINTPRFQPLFSVFWRRMKARNLKFTDGSGLIFWIQFGLGLHSMDSGFFRLEKFTK
jgi:hypothetical protein